MPRMNFKQAREGGGGGTPGAYVVRVSNVDFKPNSKGDEMAELRFVDDVTGREVCRDWIMLEGAGSGLGEKKLVQLGVDTSADEGDVEKADLLGKRIRLHLVASTYTDKDGRTFTNLKPDISRKDVGYEKLGADEEGLDEGPLPDADMPF